MQIVTYNPNSFGLMNQLAIRQPAVAPTSIANPLTKNDMRRINFYDGRGTLNGIGRGAKYLYEMRLRES
jgi:hypothetical protein